ncbi:hypothetical protein [Candidatus Pantoea bituminis]|uniref:hypothetical protein n=1 Tax=Candidatus Pantoea bituminis TaxID=2831036 RepID=UPI001C061E31|nr:hypothetical protein [Pantoea bituminis]
MPDTMDKTICDWLLREGFANSVMNEYTAVNSAVRGGLADALATEHDDALLLGAAEMIYALLNEGPVPGMSVYDDGAKVCLLYLHHVIAYQPVHPLHYLTACRIGKWAQSEESLETDLSSQLVAISAGVLVLTIWDKVIKLALAGDEDYAFNLV